MLTERMRQKQKYLCTPRRTYRNSILTGKKYFHRYNKFSIIFVLTNFTI